jgi:uncharacterized radical SAM superfamily protein
MLKYLGVAAVIAATYKLPYGIESAVTILAVLASMFYTMAFRLFTGLSQAELVEDVDILKMITIYMIYVTLAVVVFMSPFAYVTVFALPWLAIQTVINIISILLKLDVIGIKRK